jgi:YD repeat-containing protein
MKLKLFLLAMPLAVLCAVGSSVKAQPKVPVSPEAAALIKMVNYPVNFNTGIPDISVPLYTVQSGGLNMPITLNYHAGGFKIQEKATRAGMGWSLSSDIQITRSVNGIDDLEAGGYIQNNGIKVFRTNSPDLQYPISDNDALDNHKIARGEQDGMPDKFNYKLLTKSGSFYFRKNDTGSSYSIVPVPFDNIRINYVDGEFIITDTDGTTYYFGARGAMNVGERAAKCVEFTGLIKTAFKCRKIENVNRTESLNFSYQLKAPVMFNANNQSIEYYTNENPCGMDTYYRADQITASYATYESLMSQYRSYRLSSPKYMEHLSNGRSVFHFPYLDQSNNIVEKTYPAQTPNSAGTTVLGIAMARVDFRNGYVEFNGAEQLSSIKIKKPDNQQVKSFDFFQSIALPENLAAFASANGSAYATRYLDSIKCSGSTTIIETYKFLYGSKFCFGDHLQGKDAWGYANVFTSQVNENVGFTAIPETKISQMFYPSPQDACYGYGINSVFTFGTSNSQNRNIEAVDEVSLNAGMLRRIIYPTGGYVDFEYEANAVRQAVSPQQDLYAMTGGLRVKTISHYDGRSSKPATYKYYRYGDMEDGTGILVNSPYREYDVARKTFKPYNYSQTVAYMAGPGSTNIGEDFTPISSSCGSRGCLQVKFSEKRTTYVPASSTDYTYPNGAPIYYTKVTEYNSDLGGMTGKKVYNYYPPGQFGPYSFSSDAKIEGTNIPVLQTDGLMGAERLIEDYAFESGNFNLVHSKEFTYSKYSKADQIRVIYSYPKIDYHFFNGYPTGLSDASLYNLNNSFINGSQSVYDVFNAGQYGIQVAKLLLSSESEKWLKGNDVMEKTTAYEYNNPTYPQISRITTSGKNNGTVSKVLKYAYDYPGVAVCDTMKNRNMISQVIEEISYAINDNNVQVETARSKTDYAALHLGMHILPVTLFKSVGAGPLEVLMSFDLYDDHENVLQLTEKSKLVKTYLWGYNDQYPIAEINGVGYYDVTSSFNASQVYTATTITEIKAIGSSISAALPNAMVSTYAHIPMIGVAATTSPDGRSKYFSYDDYGRLVTVKDDQGYIVKKHEYVLAKTPALAKTLSTVNNPMMLTFNHIFSDNVRRVVNSVQPAGAFFNPISSLSANTYAEQNLNSYWSSMIVGEDSQKPEANVLIKLNTWPSGSIIPRAVYVDLFRNNSIVMSKRIPYNTPTNNFAELYIEPGEYKLGIRFEDNYNGSLSRLVWGSTLLRSGDLLNLQPNTEHTVVLFNE